MLLLVLVIPVLIFITYQDFRERAVSVWLFPVLGSLFLVKNLTVIDYSQYLFNTLINIGFCLIQYAILTLYFSFKNKTIINIADTVLGWGDIVFVLVLCFAFPPLMFFIYYMLSLVIATLIGFYFKLQNKTVPLAGIQALVLTLWIIIISFIFHLSLNNDDWLIDILV